MFRNLLHKLTDSFKRKAAVLMYHRIANLETDPWQLAVNAKNFEQHLQVIVKQYNVIPVGELFDNIAGAKAKKKAICITFDDAYTDNYLFAKPLLEKYGCPATFFIPTAYIGHLQPFWWDKLQSIILDAENLPASIRILIKQQVFDFELIETVLSEEINQKHKAWIWHSNAPTKRCELYLALWSRLQPLTYSEILRVIDELGNWAGYTPSADADNLPMNNDQLEKLCRQPLFDIGVHTCTHPALAYHNKEMQTAEILDCRKYLENLSSRRINSIAYPYGNYNDTTLSIVKDQDFSIAFTTKPQVVSKSSDPHLSGRFQVINQSGYEFEKQLRLWTGGF